MHDQANDLRRLVSSYAAPELPAAGRRPTLAVVTGGKGGVGTTTIAVNLAVAVAQGPLRTVLVDADPRGGDAAILCGLEHRYTLADVLSGQRTTAEVLRPGPGAVRVLPGIRRWERPSGYPPAAAKRLLGRLEDLNGHTDLVVLDAGSGTDGMLQRLGQTADLILVITTPETPSIIDTYASIRALAEKDRTRPIHALVNLAPTASVAQDVQRRLAQACRCLLGFQLQSAGHVPTDPQAVMAATAAEPFVIAAPGCNAARQVNRLARKLAGSVADRRTRKTPMAINSLQLPNSRRPSKPRKNQEKDSTSSRTRPIWTEHYR